MCRWLVNNLGHLGAVLKSLWIHTILPGNLDMRGVPGWVREAVSIAIGRQFGI